MTAETVPLESRHTRLRPPGRALLEQLYDLATTDQIPWWWSGPETPAAFQESLWEGVVAQFAIEDRRNGEQIGLLSAYGANTYHRYCYVSMVLLPSFQMRVWPLEAPVLFANYLFVRFNLRKLYAESVTPYFASFSSGSKSLFVVEGCMRGRVIMKSEVVDLYTLTFTRERWLESGKQLMERCLSGPTRRALQSQVDETLTPAAKRALLERLAGLGS